MYDVSPCPCSRPYPYLYPPGHRPGGCPSHGAYRGGPGAHLLPAPQAVRVRVKVRVRLRLRLRVRLRVRVGGGYRD